jgi:hypothetical protein
MGYTVANLRSALDRPPPPGSNRAARYRPPYYPPPPLGALTRLDPLGKLALSAAIVAPLIVLGIVLS